MCPDWIARKKSANTQADINEHRSLCKQHNCGYGDRDYYVYSYVDAGELMGLLQNAPIASEPTRKPRAKGATIPAAPSKEEDLLGLDEDLMGGTSGSSQVEDLL